MDGVWRVTAKKRARGRRAMKNENVANITNGIGGGRGVAVYCVAPADTHRHGASSTTNRRRDEPFAMHACTASALSTHGRLGPATTSTQRSDADHTNNTWITTLTTAPCPRVRCLEYAYHTYVPYQKERTFTVRFSCQAVRVWRKSHSIYFHWRTQDFILWGYKFN